MSKFGTVGSVRFCTRARLDVYGEPGGASSATSSSGGGGETVGPCDGPLTGPAPAAGCSRGKGFERGPGAGASLVRVFANSILVAIYTLPTYLRVLHLPWSPGSRPRRRCSRSRFRAFCGELTIWEMFWRLMRRTELGAWQELRASQPPAACGSIIVNTNFTRPPSPRQTHKLDLQLLTSTKQHSYNRHHEPSSASMGPCMCHPQRQTPPLLTYNSPEMTSMARTTPHTSRPWARTSTLRVQS
jgi:hypothetical protein